jgi:hypothetical protein
MEKYSSSDSSYDLEELKKAFIAAKDRKTTDEIIEKFKLAYQSKNISIINRINSKQT